MKKILLFFAAALLFLLLSGCGEKTGSVSVRVAAEETPWAVIENNGLTVMPGEDAVLTITARDGYSLVGTNYQGETEIRQEGSRIRLILRDVRYPTRITLELTQESYALRYEPNGAEGEAFTRLQDRKTHLRPNTANADVPFSRPGWTLTGWNTQPDGSGISAGLGSRITVGEEGITLYAQWAEWTDDAFFSWEVRENGAVITGCSFGGDTVVIPGELGGLRVTALAAGALDGCPAESAILPESLRTAEPGCFVGSGIRELTLFDNIETISDDCFSENQLQTLHINAAEAPAGAAVYKESCYADKMDLLILSQEQNRVIFYGGCSMWYNLDMPKVLNTLGDDWYPVNMALNGTVNSELQLQLLLPYLHEGDLFFHTPELSSDPQMLRTTDMGSNEGRLWAGIEYNYDLLAAADLRTVTGELDSLCQYLSGKTEQTSYADRYKDSKGRLYCGTYGEIPFSRYEQETGGLSDIVTLTPELVSEDSIRRLGQWYARFQEKGVRVAVSYACVNLDALTPEEQGNVHPVDDAFRAAIEAMPGVTLISDLTHFLYHNGNFFDTNYHLLSDMASSCTSAWMKGLKPLLAS